MCYVNLVDWSCRGLAGRAEKPVAYNCVGKFGNEVLFKFAGEKWIGAPNSFKILRNVIPDFWEVEKRETLELGGSGKGNVEFWVVT